jgi:hypothetical protein
MTELMAIMSAVLGVGVVLVVSGTVRRNRWGINLESVNCPRCEQQIPQVRMPVSLSQTLWGGATCERCGCEVDKWGREIDSL